MPAVGKQRVRQVGEIVFFDHAQPEIVVFGVAIGPAQTTGFQHGLSPENHGRMGHGAAQFAHVAPDLAGRLGKPDGLRVPAMSVDHIDGAAYQSYISVRLQEIHLLRQPVGTRYVVGVHARDEFAAGFLEPPV